MSQEASLAAVFGDEEPITRVVNIRNEQCDVYIGRGSPWGNPYSHLPYSAATYKVGSREEAVENYREYILAKPDLLARLSELKGKRLGCWCFPQKCHGDVLVELCNAQVI